MSKKLTGGVVTPYVDTTYLKDEMSDRICYKEFHPESQSEALSMAHSVFRTTSTLLSLFNSGTGSGKTRMMHSMALDWHTTHTPKGLIYLLPPSTMIGDQLLNEFEKTHIIFKCHDFSSSHNLEKKIREALRKGEKVLVSCPNVGHRDGKFTKETSILLEVMSHMYEDEFQQLVLIDELHSSLTKLVGGMNARINHASNDMEHYSKICSQTDMSLNIFTKFKRYGARIACFSATMNNVICSKLPSIGYEYRDIQICNIYPIKALYSEMKCTALDTNDFSQISAHLAKAEAEEGKILLIFSTKKDIEKFIDLYELHFRRPMPANVSITGDTDLTDIDAALYSAKYVMGINLLGTGFDLGTHVNNSAFSLGILFRSFSDTGSQPLSANPDHLLHMDISALMIQALGRLRKGGVFLIPACYAKRAAGINLFDLQYQISETIRIGYTEYERLGFVATNQTERYHLTLVLALQHSMKVDGVDRPIVEDILNDLKDLTGRDFRSEMTAPNFCIRFWTRVMGTLWAIYLEDHNHKLTYSPKYRKTVASTVLVKIRRARDMIFSGRGHSDGRVLSESIKREVQERSGNICGHCGLKGGHDMQVCHIMSHARGGPFLLDNLLWGHRACDAVFDAGDLILDPEGGVWVHPRINFKPDTLQIKYISVGYVQDRWEQHRGRFCASGELREWLTTNGYERRGL